MTSSTTESTNKTQPDEPIIQLSQAQLQKVLATLRLPIGPYRSLFLCDWRPVLEITATFDASFMDDPQTLERAYTRLYELLGVKLP